MKRLTVLLLGIIFLLTVNYAQGQQSEGDEYRTIFNDSLQISGFGGPMMNFTTMTGNFAHFMGGGGAVLVNNTFFLGGYGMGKTNVNRLSEGTYKGMNYDVGHGGFWLGYNFNPNAPVHPVFSVMAGWGAVSVGEDDDDDTTSTVPQKDDRFFVIQPSLEVEANITRYFKISAGVNYQYFTGINGIKGYNDSDFSNLGAIVHFKFGGFGG